MYNIVAASPNINTTLLLINAGTEYETCNLFDTTRNATRSDALPSPWALKPQAAIADGKLEWFENLVNQYLMGL